MKKHRKALLKAARALDPGATLSNKKGGGGHWTVEFTNGATVTTSTKGNGLHEAAGEFALAVRDGKGWAHYRQLRNAGQM